MADGHVAQITKEQARAEAYSLPLEKLDPAQPALFQALEQTVRTGPNRQLIRLPLHINDPAFATALVQQFRTLHAGRRRERAGGGRP